MASASLVRPWRTPSGERSWTDPSYSCRPLFSRTPATSRSHTARTRRGRSAMAPDVTGPGRRPSESPAGRITSWPNHQLAESPAGRITSWPNHQLAESPAGRITSWPNHQLAESPAGRITSWPNHQLAESPAGRNHRLAEITGRLGSAGRPGSARRSDAFPGPALARLDRIDGERVAEAARYVRRADQRREADLDRRGLAGRVDPQPVRGHRVARGGAVVLCVHDLQGGVRGGARRERHGGRGDARVPVGRVADRATGWGHERGTWVAVENAGTGGDVGEVQWVEGTPGCGAAAAGDERHLKASGGARAPRAGAARHGGAARTGADRGGHERGRLPLGGLRCHLPAGGALNGSAGGDQRRAPNESRRGDCLPGRVGRWCHGRAPYRGGGPCSGTHAGSTTLTTLTRAPWLLLPVIA